MATFVLVPGACHSGSCWALVEAFLEEKGHSVFAPDLPGTGADRTPLADDVLEQWTVAVAAVVEAQAQPVMLVGHSRGGLLVSAVAERVPERVLMAVYVAGCMLADGQGVMDAYVLSEDLLSAVVPRADGMFADVDPARAVELFYAQAAPDVARTAVERLIGEPAQPSGARLNLHADRFGKVPRAYIETANDRVIPLSKQREMQAHWPCQVVVTLHRDHCPFYSMPKCLADTLHGLI